MKKHVLGLFAAFCGIAIFSQATFGGEVLRCQGDRDSSRPHLRVKIALLAVDPEDGSQIFTATVFGENREQILKTYVFPIYDHKSNPRNPSIKAFSVNKNERANPFIPSIGSRGTANMPAGYFRLELGQEQRLAADTKTLRINSLKIHCQ